MENTVTAQEIKRRGITAVDEALRHGPVHVIQRNRPRYVILSEEDYRRMMDLPRARTALWNKLLDASNETGRARHEIDKQLQEERGVWDR